ncbi:hypothetical protein DUNSADRAFT_1829 [Dunaliella salina]|uniref:Encoded protein n=1 Tax=Dunaliella salina TaxID=3046 RepID=A0ABQ7FX11_DUNSA|nr:hypothetical protein DUNSADRAFT_1829 [Dunaliella salina]|eukprot:KAF5826883.1 hypothetical protein DUNSADRAFT_1829 [Dunaliella salina]
MLTSSRYGSKGWKRRRHRRSRGEGRRRRRRRRGGRRRRRNRLACHTHEVEKMTPVKARIGVNFIVNLNLR